MQLRNLNNLNFILLISILLLIVIPIRNLQAQVSCTQTLVDAQEVFSSGQIELVPEILESCLINGFTKQEKISAYRLLTLCHLYYNRTAEASLTMEKMLKFDPEYQIQDIDPSEFINLHSTFRTTPILIVGLKGGVGSFNFYNTTNYNDISSVGYAGSYSPNLSLMGGLSIEAPIFAEFSIVAEVLYNTYSYDFSKTILEYANISFTETVTGIEMPFLLQWNILKDQQITPYLNAGSSFFLTLSSSGNLTRKDTLTGGQSRELALPQGVDLTASRTSLNVSFTAGTGVRIKDIIGKGYITFDVRYSRYFLNTVEAKNRGLNPSLTYSYLHTDNSFKLENFQFLIGYKIPIYFPKQKKSARGE